MLTTQELLPVVLTLVAIVATYFYLNAKSNVWASHSNHKSPPMLTTFNLEEILNPKVFKSFKLIEKIPISHNTSK